YHAHREREREDLHPALVRGEPRLVAGAAVLEEERHQEPCQRDRERREEDVEPDVQPELGAREEQGIFHGERSLVELVKSSMDEAARSPIPAPGPSGDVKRGKLKVFFGAFPGAGKTNAMLSAAQRMRD